MTPASWWSAWVFPWPTLAALVISLELYVLAYRRVSAFPRIRLLYFLAAMASLAVALLSPVGTYDGILFWVHMVQHLILIFVTAPLLSLSSPVALTLRALPPRGRRRLSRVLNSPPFKLVTHPLFTWTLFPVVLWWTHFSGIYEATLLNPAIHAGEHLLYLIAGYLFWRPIVGLDPGPRHPNYLFRFLYLMAAMAPMAALGVTIYSSTHVLYPYYQSIRSSPQLSWLPPALADQALGGEIMWVLGFFMFIIAIVFLFFAWMRHERLEEMRIDRRLDRIENRKTEPSADPIDTLKQPGSRTAG